MNKMILMAATMIAGAMLVGCQTMPYQPYARAVKVEPETGGIIALRTEFRDEDRVKAQSMMAQNCATNTVKIVEEGEAVTGTVTNAKETNQAGSSGSQVGSLFGIPVTSGGNDPSKSTATETTTKKEWQIKYTCLAAAQTPAKKTKTR